MFRKSLLIVLFLIPVCGVILVWQWNVYSNTQEKKPIVSQNILVHIQENSLSVTQRLSGMDVSKALMWPQQVQDVSCVTVDGEACRITDEGFVTTTLRNVDEFILTYHLNKSEKTSLMVDWLFKIKERNIFTTIELSDSSEVEGNWFSNLPEVAKKQLDLVEYYQFEGVNSSPVLYWQPGSWVKTDINKQLTLFSNQSIEAIGLPTIGGGHTTIIVDASLSSVHYPNFHVLSSLSEIEDVAKLNKVAYLNERFNYSDDWIKDFLLATLVQEVPSAEKSQYAYHEFQYVFSDEEWDTWEKELSKWEDEVITPTVLDSITGKVLNGETEFFKQIAQQPNTDAVLMMKLPTVIQNKSKRSLPISSYMYKNERLYPLRETLIQLDYSVKTLSSESSFLVQQKGKMYRFYDLRSYYILNEEEFSLADDSFFIWNDTLLIKEKALSNLFQLTIEKQPQAITIKRND
ncbi:hypothetical protein WAK64_03080 [Bacillus spongiae]|uniref:Copper amine oxidase-like N-terminal domain-containing protein n=1 Tax=Bacillus spongiae TaxID=2683610 RepID=A0ABU8H9Q6_9BACI